MVDPEATFSPDDELDAGFKAAQAWFLANKDEMEQREEALAQEIAQRLGVNPDILRGRMCHLREQLDAVEQLALARNWSDEMREIELDRMVDLAIENLRLIPWIEAAIRRESRKPDLPVFVLAELPGALSAVRRTHPDSDPKKGSVVREIKRLLKENHNHDVSEERIAREVPADFASRH